MADYWSSVSPVGVFLGRFRKEEPAEYERNFAELLSLYDEGTLRPIVTQSYPFSNYVDAFNVFTERRVMGKVTLEVKAEVKPGS
jgi:NADPH2:quinone reductase